VTSLSPPKAGELAPLPPVVTPDTPATSARRIIREARLRSLPVVKDEKTMKYMGVLRRRSLLLLSSTRSNILVRDLLEDARLTLDVDDPIIDAARRMLEADEPYPPVLSGDRVAAVLGYEHIIEYILRSEKETLREPIEKHMTAAPLVTVAPEDYVYHAWQLMLTHNLPALPVLDGTGRLVGVIAEYDLLARGYARPELESGAVRRGPRVREVMSTPPVVVAPDETVARAAELVVGRGVGRVYVVDSSGKLLGVVDRSDIVKAWLENKSP
jgi:CBS domain-containing protein